MSKFSFLLLNSNCATGHCLDWSHWCGRQHGYHLQCHSWPGDLLPQEHRALDKERRHRRLPVLAVFHDTRGTSDLGCRRCVLLYPRGYSSKSIKGLYAGITSLCLVFLRSARQSFFLGESSPYLSSSPQFPQCGGTYACPLPNVVPPCVLLYTQGEINFSRLPSSRGSLHIYKDGRENDVLKPKAHFPTAP